MTEISAIPPIQVISDYTRKTYVGNDLVTTHVQYQKTNAGNTIVNEVTYTTYNAKGEIEPPRKPEGTKLDILV